MKIVKGADRIVYILKDCPFVIKLPVIRLQKGISCFFVLLKRPCLLKQLLYGVDLYGTPQRFIFHGIVSNWREFWFSLTSRNILCSPTYFSFLGFVNIQRKEYGIKKEDNLFSKLILIAGDKVFKAGHTICNNHNFGRRNGQIVIVDYSSKEMQKIVNKYPTAFYIN